MRLLLSLPLLLTKKGADRETKIVREKKEGEEEYLLNQGQ